MIEAIDPHLAEKVGKLAQSLKQNGLAANMEEATDMAKRILLKDESGEKRSASATRALFEEPLFARDQDIDHQVPEKSDGELPESKKIETHENSQDPELLTEPDNTAQTTLVQEFPSSDALETTPLPPEDLLTQEGSLHVEEEVVTSDDNSSLESEEYPLLSAVSDIEEHEGTQLTLDPLEGIDRIDPSQKASSVHNAVSEDIPSSENTSKEISPQEKLQDPMPEDLKPADFEIPDDDTTSTQHPEEKPVEEKSSEKWSWSLKRFFGFGKK
ncbi:hypothetical protein HYW21_08230 [Candidatus Woesearchaeota archaeon]|nr:hypothetical protein [Candidatus Woesearchaeota archaeon]